MLNLILEKNEAKVLMTHPAQHRYLTNQMLSRVIMSSPITAGPILSTVNNTQASCFKRNLIRTKNKHISVTTETCDSLQFNKYNHRVSFISFMSLAASYALSC